MNQHGKYSTTLVPKNTSGWHLQPISLLVNAANKFESEIVVKFGQRMTSAKSHLGILALGAGRGAKLYVSACGHDAQKAIKAIKNKFSAGPDNSAQKRKTSMRIPPRL
ncbi:MAG: HPr family phosphocarrier protein [bacterium]